jgi:membrane protein DedA with SNARE-associated domain
VTKVATTGARTVLLAAAGVRALVGIIAIPLAPVLYREHFVALVLLRPTKEVLLAGGFLVRQGDVSLPPVLLAAVPLAVFGVWLFFWLGRAYADELQDGGDLPAWGRRVLPPERVKALCKILDRRGHNVVILGRLAAFPSALLAAAAGASGMSPRTFVLADSAGAALSMAESLAAGYLLGEAYKRAGVWITVVGVVVLIVVVVLMGRWLRREES